MAIFKYVDLNHCGLNPKSPNLICNEINYILNDYKLLHNYWGGYNFLKTPDTQNIIMQFQTLRKIYNKDNYVAMRHFVLSFSPEFDDVTPYQAAQIAERVAWIFAGEYQVIYAVHENTENPHIHFLVNPINIYTGKLLDMGKAAYKDLLFQIHVILQCPSMNGKHKPIKLINPGAY